MFRMFGGMIIGSMMTIVLLGGPNAEGQMFENARLMMEQQYAQPDSANSLLLILIVGFSIASLVTTRTKQTRHTAKIVNKLRRYCS